MLSSSIPTGATNSGGSFSGSSTERRESDPNTGASMDGKTANGLNAAAKATVDYQSFLKLLTTQLQNQDPLAPMDATQFITQLAQFSTVEQALESNRKLSEVLEMLKESSSRLDMAYLGRTIRAPSDTFGLIGGSSTGIAYAVDASAASVRLEVLDEAGRIVHARAGSAEAGQHAFVWDGRRSDGSQSPDGTYRLRVVARNSAGDTVGAATVVTDVVSEVRYSGGATVFVTKGGAQVSPDGILSAS